MYDSPKLDPQFGPTLYNFRFIMPITVKKIGKCRYLHRAGGDAADGQSDRGRYDSPQHRCGVINALPLTWEEADTRDPMGHPCALSPDQRRSIIMRHIYKVTGVQGERKEKVRAWLSKDSTVAVTVPETSADV